MALGVKDGLGTRCVKKNFWCVKNAWKHEWKHAWKHAWKCAWKRAWKSKNVVREKKRTVCEKVRGNLRGKNVTVFRCILYVFGGAEAAKKFMRFFKHFFMQVFMR